MDRRIDQLPQAESLGDNDLLVVQQGGVSKKANASTVLPGAGTITIRQGTAIKGAFSTNEKNNKVITLDATTNFNALTNRPQYKGTMMTSSTDIEPAYAFSVKDYGAAGDGTTDDTTAIQSAFNAAYAADGTVYFPAGRYRITSPVSLTGNAHKIAIKGENSAISEIFYDGNNSIALQLQSSAMAYGRTISDLAIVCSGNNAAGLYLMGQGQCSLSNLFLYNSANGGVGIYLDSSSQVFMTNVQVQGFGKGLTVNGNDEYGDVYLTNCRFDGNSSVGVEIVDAQGIFANNVTCYENRRALTISGTKNSLFANCVFDSSKLENATISYSERLKFSNCWFSDNITFKVGDGSNNVSMSYVERSEFNCCSVNRGARQGIYAEACSGLLVNGCRFEDNDYMMFYVPALRFAYSDHCMATANQFSNPDGKQQICIGTYDADYIVITGNDLSSAAIPLDVNVENCVVENNLGG